MKYLFSIQFIGFVLLCHGAIAQVEHWDTYLTRMDNKSGSILVDMGLITSAPDKKYPNLVITGPQAQNCNKQGMPAGDEIATLEEILAATGNFITGITPKILAGTFTYNCQRLNYYYVKDTTGIRNALARMYSRSYKNYNFAIKIKADKEWSVYRTFLYPDEATENWMENNKILSRMLKEGDSLKTTRDVSFNLYFNTDTGRKAFEHEAAIKGYQTRRMTQSTKPPVLYGIILYKNSMAKADTINAMTAELKATAKRHNGYFKDWNGELKGK